MKLGLVLSTAMAALLAGGLSAAQAADTSMWVTMGGNKPLHQVIHDTPHFSVLPNPVGTAQDKCSRRGGMYETNTPHFFTACTPTSMAKSKMDS